MAHGTAPSEVKMSIRPEDLTRTDTSRLAVTQTLGGAWCDNFGLGIPTVQISGHTGWGGGSAPDGFLAFQNLHMTIFQQWHALREAALNDGLDPDLVRLIFADALDDFTWVVAPQNFILKRNKARPLLSQYQINLIWLSNDVSATMAANASAKAAAGAAAGTGTQSLEQRIAAGAKTILQSLSDIKKFITSKVSGVLGTLKAAFDKVVSVTAAALNAVMSVVNAGMSLVGSVASTLIGFATSIAKAASNITGIVTSIMSIPGRIKGMFMAVKSAFSNAFCALKNIFKVKPPIPSYDDLYGASSCSSTSGGRSISKYVDGGGIAAQYPVEKSPIDMSSNAAQALDRMQNADHPVAPVSAESLKADMDAIGTISVAA